MLRDSARHMLITLASYNNYDFLQLAPTPVLAPGLCAWARISQMTREWALEACLGMDSTCCMVKRKLSFGTKTSESQIQLCALRK
jgi:hypothetical protein